MPKPDLASLETDDREGLRRARADFDRDPRRDARGGRDRARPARPGPARVAERQADGSWHVNQWLKKAVLLSFRLKPMEIIKGGPGDAVWWDKVPLEVRRLERQSISKRPASAPCRRRSCAAPPISRRAWC